MEEEKLEKIKDVDSNKTSEVEIEQKTQEQFEEMQERETEEDVALKKRIEELRYNRATRRRLAHPLHHNIYTKKYKSKKHREKAWLSFLGLEEYIQVKRVQKAFLKKAKLIEKENRAKRAQERAAMKGIQTVLES